MSKPMKFKVGPFRVSICDNRPNMTHNSHKMYAYRCTITDTRNKKKRIEYAETESGAAYRVVVAMDFLTKKDGSFLHL